MAALRDGGLELRSIVSAPGDAVPVLWPDQKMPGFLRYLADGPNAHVYKIVAKSLQVLDANYNAAPGPIYRFGPTDDRLILVLPGGPAGGVEIAAAAPAVPVGRVPIATVPTLAPSSVLGVTCDEVAAYGATTTSILQFLNGATRTLHDAPDGSAGPRGPIAVNHGVVYWLAGTDVFSVGVDAGAAAQLGANMNAQALAVDDACVYVVTGDDAIVAFAHGGGGADVTKSEARNVTAVSASKLGVFWTTAGVAPRAYAMLRPLPE